MHRLKLLAVPLLALILVAATGCATDQAIRAQAVGAHTELQPAVINDPELANYLQTVGERIITAARQLDAKGEGPKAHFKEDSKWMFGNDVKFHLVSSDTLNAFTTGGTHMYIYNGLLQNCQTEDELAAVMAHEFAHIYGRHVQKGTNRQMALAGGATALGVAGSAVGGEQLGGLVGQLGPAALQLFGMSYTRSDEDEADKWGFYFYTRAGWDPTKFDDFFQSMIAKGYDTTPEYMSDHPKLSTRVNNTQRRVKELAAEVENPAKWRKSPVADGARFAQIKARANQVAKTVPSSESVMKAKALLASFSSCVSPADNQPEQVAVRRAMAQRSAQPAGAQQTQRAPAR